jgi:hypothetical protein
LTERGAQVFPFDVFASSLKLFSGDGVETVQQCLGFEGNLQQGMTFVGFHLSLLLR